MMQTKTQEQKKSARGGFAHRMLVVAEYTAISIGVIVGGYEMVTTAPGSAKFAKAAFPMLESAAQDSMRVRVRSATPIKKSSAITVKFENSPPAIIDFSELTPNVGKFDDNTTVSFTKINGEEALVVVGNLLSGYVMDGKRIAVPGCQYLKQNDKVLSVSFPGILAKGAKFPGAATLVQRKEHGKKTALIFYVSPEFQFSKISADAAVLLSPDKFAMESSDGVNIYYTDGQNKYSAKIN